MTDNRCQDMPRTNDIHSNPCSTNECFSLTRVTRSYYFYHSLSVRLFSPPCFIYRVLYVACENTSVRYWLSFTVPQLPLSIHLLGSLSIAYPNSYQNGWILTSLKCSLISEGEARCITPEESAPRSKKKSMVTEALAISALAEF